MAPDGAPVSIRTSTGVRLFVTGAVGPSRFGTFKFDGASLETLDGSFELVIGPGQPQSFDECGAWILGARADADNVTAWYHAEERCRYNGVPRCNGDPCRPGDSPVAGKDCSCDEPARTLKSVGVAFSTNGGLSFDTASRRQVISAFNLPPDTPPSGFAGNWGQGDHSVVEWDDGGLLYFSGPDATGIGVARIGTDVRKWWDGHFSEPGLGGHAASLGALLGNARSASRTEDFVVLTGDCATREQGCEPTGVYTYFSTDGVSFARSGSPLLPQGNQGISAFPDEAITYASIIPPSGDSYAGQWTDSFYLFYMYADPGADANRALVRRRVTVARHPTAVTNKIALSRYWSEARRDHWITTSIVPGDYKHEFDIGYLLTSPEPDTMPLVECYIESADGKRFDDHLLAANDCGGWLQLRTLGWVYTAPGPGRVPLVRCWWEGELDHFANCEHDCGGFPEEWLLGYVIAPHERCALADGTP